MVRRIATCIAVLAGASLLFFGLAAAASSPSSPSHNHSEAVHAAEVHHAHVVHAMAVHHAAELRQARTIEHRDWLVAMTTPVSICEEGARPASPTRWLPGGDAPGGYASSGFPDAIGMTSATWQEFGYGSDLRPFVQAKALQRFVEHYGIAWPDRVVCAGY